MPRFPLSIRIFWTAGARQGPRSCRFRRWPIEAPDPTADVCWLPGGYPELHAGRSPPPTNFRTGLRAFARTKPVHGECGGYMAMGAGLIDKDGSATEMAGLLGLVTSFARRAGCILATAWRDPDRRHARPCRRHPPARP